ncbi:MAG: molybdopterin molybdotransferase MoeA [Bacteroidales bacterium]|nr:molybdopterin molybdotransferase MoeA [Bacteroidales bacterium]
MITFQEATDIVLSNSLNLPSLIIPLSECVGRVLAEDILADRDMPPFNKAAVDGFACRRADLIFKPQEHSGRGLKIIETIPAGYRPSLYITEGECSRIMTGAVVPEGADYILMVEESEVNERYMKTRADSPSFGGGNKPAVKGSNICYKGEDIRKGETILKAGTTIGTAHIAALAGNGVCRVRVSAQPKIGVFSTGDEIVEPEVTPLDYQIRDSNGMQLTAQAKSCSHHVTFYGVVKDSEQELHLAIQKASDECDILIITGGVSMGEFDYVPKVLTGCGFKTLFDKIAVQPGKPSTFGVKEVFTNLNRDGSPEKKVVFALPGNPVSSYIQFEMLIRPFIIKSMGGGHLPKSIMMTAGKDFDRRRSERCALIPVSTDKEGIFMPVNYNGSAHILAMTLANGVAIIPSGIKKISKGERAEVIILHQS